MLVPSSPSIPVAGLVMSPRAPHAMTAVGPAFRAPPATPSKPQRRGWFCCTSAGGAESPRAPSAASRYAAAPLAEPPVDALPPEERLRSIEAEVLAWVGRHPDALPGSWAELQGSWSSAGADAKVAPGSSVLLDDTQGGAVAPPDTPLQPLLPAPDGLVKTMLKSRAKPAPPACPVDALSSAAWAELCGSLPPGVVPSAAPQHQWDPAMAKRVLLWCVALTPHRHVPPGVLPAHALAHASCTAGLESLQQCVEVGGRPSPDVLGALLTALLARASRLARLRLHAIALATRRLGTVPPPPPAPFSDRSHLVQGTHRTAVSDPASGSPFASQDTPTSTDSDWSTVPGRSLDLAVLPGPGSVAAGAWSLPAVDARLVRYVQLLHWLLCEALAASTCGEEGEEDGPLGDGRGRRASEASGGISDDGSETLRAHEDLLSGLGVTGDGILASITAEHDVRPVLLRGPARGEAASTPSSLPSDPHSAGSLPSGRSRLDSARASVVSSATLREIDVDFFVGLPWVLHTLAVPGTWAAALMQAEAPAVGPKVLAGTESLPTAQAAYPGAGSPSVGGFSAMPSGRDSAAGRVKPPLAGLAPAPAASGAGSTGKPTGSRFPLPTSPKTSGALATSKRFRGFSQTTGGSSVDSSEARAIASASASAAPGASTGDSSPLRVATTPLGREAVSGFAVSKTGSITVSDLVQEPSAQGSSMSKGGGGASPTHSASGRHAPPRSHRSSTSGVSGPKRAMAPTGAAPPLSPTPTTSPSYASLRDGHSLAGRNRLTSHSTSTTESSAAERSEREASADPTARSSAAPPEGDAPHTEALALALADPTGPAPRFTPLVSEAADEDRGLFRVPNELTDISMSLHSRVGLAVQEGRPLSGRSQVTIPRLTFSPRARARNQSVLRLGSDAHSARAAGAGDATGRLSHRGGPGRTFVSRVSIVEPVAGGGGGASGRGIALDRPSFGPAGWANQSVISMAVSQAVTVEGTAAAARRVRSMWAGLMQSPSVLAASKGMSCRWARLDDAGPGAGALPRHVRHGSGSGSQALEDPSGRAWWAHYHPAASPDGSPAGSSTAPLQVMEGFLNLHLPSDNARPLCTDADAVQPERQTLCPASQRSSTAWGVLEGGAAPPHCILALVPALPPIAPALEAHPAFAGMPAGATEEHPSVPAARVLPLLLAAASDAGRVAARQVDAAASSAPVPPSCLPQAWLHLVRLPVQRGWLARHPDARDTSFLSPATPVKPSGSVLDEAPLALHGAAMASAAHEALVDAAQRLVLCARHTGHPAALHSILVTLSQVSVLVAGLCEAARTVVARPALISVLTHHDRMLPIPPFRLASIRAAVGGTILAVSSVVALLASTTAEMAALLAPKAPTASHSPLAGAVPEHLAPTTPPLHWFCLRCMAQLSLGAAQTVAWRVIAPIRSSSMAPTYRKRSVGAMFTEGILAGTVRLLLQAALTFRTAQLRSQEAAATPTRSSTQSGRSGSHSTWRRGDQRSLLPPAGYVSALSLATRLGAALSTVGLVSPLSVVMNPLFDSSHSPAELQLAARVVATYHISPGARWTSTSFAPPLVLDPETVPAVWLADSARTICSLVMVATTTLVTSLSKAHSGAPESDSAPCGDSSDVSSEASAAVPVSAADSLSVALLQSALRVSGVGTTGAPPASTRRLRGADHPDITDTVMSVETPGGHPGEGLLKDGTATAMRRALRKNGLSPASHRRRLGGAWLTAVDDTAEGEDAATHAFEAALQRDAALTATLVLSGWFTVLETALTAVAARPPPSALKSGPPPVRALSGQSAPIGTLSPASATSGAASGATPAGAGRPPMPNRRPSFGTRASASDTGGGMSPPFAFDAVSLGGEEGRPGSQGGGIASPPQPQPQAKPIKYIDMDASIDSADLSWDDDDDDFEIGSFLGAPVPVPAPAPAPVPAAKAAPAPAPASPSVHVIDMGLDGSTASWGSESEFNLDEVYGGAPAQPLGPPPSPSHMRKRSGSLDTMAALAAALPEAGSPSPPGPPAHGGAGRATAAPSPAQRRRVGSAGRVRSATVQPPRGPGLAIPRLAVVDKADALAGGVGGVGAAGAGMAMGTAFALPPHLRSHPVLRRLLAPPAMHVAMLHAALSGLISPSGATVNPAFHRRFPAQDPLAGHPFAALHEVSAASLQGDLKVYGGDGSFSGPEPVAHAPADGVDPGRALLGEPPLLLEGTGEVSVEDEGRESDEEDVVIVVSRPASQQLPSARSLAAWDRHGARAHDGSTIPEGSHSDSGSELADGARARSDASRSQPAVQLPTQPPPRPSAAGTEDRLDLSISEDGSVSSAGPMGESGAVLSIGPSDVTEGLVSPLPGRMASPAVASPWLPKANSSRLPSQERGSSHGLGLLTLSVASSDSRWTEDEERGGGGAGGTPSAAPSSTTRAGMWQAPASAHPATILSSMVGHQAQALARISSGGHEVAGPALPLPHNILFALQRHLNTAAFAPMLPWLCRLSGASGIATVRLLRLLCRGCMDVSVYGEGSRIGRGAYGEVVEVSWVPPLSPSPTALVAMALADTHMWSPSLAAFAAPPEGEDTAAAALALREGAGPLSQAIPPPTFPLAAKQVQLPTSADDQMPVGDLFTSVALYQNTMAEHFATHVLPPVPRLWDFGLTVDSYWLVTERCATNASSWRKTLPGSLQAEDVPAILAVFAAVCRAVAWLHDRGVTHYDIKADNVLLRWRPSRAALTGAMRQVLQAGPVPFVDGASDRQPRPHPADATAPRWLKPALQRQLESPHASDHVRGFRTRSPASTAGAASDAEGLAGDTAFLPLQGAESPAERPLFRHLLPNHLVALTDFGEATYTPGLPARAGWCAMSPGTDCIKAPEVLALGGRDKAALTGMDIDRTRLRGSTHTADVWSLGCLLVELLTGVSPFAGECESQWVSFYSRVTGGSAPGVRDGEGGGSSGRAAPPPPVLEAAVLDQLQAALALPGSGEATGVKQLLDMCFTRDPARRADAHVVASVAEACARRVAEAALK